MNSQRLPGLAIFYSELVHGIPPIFKHYVANVPALHSILVFILFKSLPISRVLEEKRFIFRPVQPKELQVFRCVVRYRYKDMRNEEDLFEQLLIELIKEFVRAGSGGGDRGFGLSVEERGGVPGGEARGDGEEGCKFEEVGGDRLCIPFHEEECEEEQYSV
ncbi:hypothetical protein C2S53_019400 [Perilla frutescens var. hirtella]|uniref:K+ potassium transporter C-terminal domain-containing protein n=1 Tax=Perilla frutescens var. hirtella TaxID=608512 RepID=A0AAD4J6U0_PERFH|nr:hypothetical protein C2S53_019400 [Perilla frutescens var. hirtella]